MRRAIPEMNVLPGAPGQPVAGQPAPPQPDREPTGSIGPRNVPLPSRRVSVR